MKKIISIALIMCLFGTSVMAQSKTAYLMDGYNYRHELNPAASPYRGYVNLLGHYAIGVNSNLSATQFLYPSADGNELYTFLHPNVSTTDFLNSLNKSNMLNVNADIDVLGFGFYAGRGYVSFDTKLHVGLNANLPKEFFAFLKKGMDSDHTVYDIRNLNVSASAYASAGLGYAYDIFDNLRVGVKAKYLVGIAGLNANIDQMRIDMSSNGWAINTQATMNAYGYGIHPTTGTTDEEGNEVATDYITGITFNEEEIAPAGKGFAFDVGVTYSPIKNLNVSAALTNIGGITWDANAVVNAQSTGEVAFSGLELDMEATGEDAIGELTEDLTDGMMNMIQFVESNKQEKKYQKLDSRFLLAADYAVWKDRINAGLIYTLDNTAYGHFNELTAAANISLLQDIQLSGSYTLFSDYGRSFGLALNFCSLLYISWDHILMNFSPQYIPLDVLSTQVEVGLRIPIGKYKKRELPKLFYFSE